MKWRWLGITGGMVGVALIVILILPSIIDANRFRPKMESDLSLALNRKVSIGNVRLAILSGGVKVYDLSVADDPAFSSEPFVLAKSLTVGVEFGPLLFSHHVHFTQISIAQAQITLRRSKAGAWNYSTLGSARSTSPEGVSAPAPSGNASNPKASIRKLSIADADLRFGDAGSSSKPIEYTNANIEVSDFSYAAEFRFRLSANTPGNGTLKIDGQAGPLNIADLVETPANANLAVKDFNLVSSGWVESASGIGGILDFTGDFVSDGQHAHSKGKIHVTKFRFARNATPSTLPLGLDYGLEYEWKPQTGRLTQGDVHIGKDIAQLAGGFHLTADQVVFDLNFHGNNMAAPDLQPFFPAVGTALPSQSSLPAGTLEVNLILAGAINSLVTTGSVNLSHAMLAGFDLGTRLGALSSLAGLPKAPDTVIQELRSNVRVTPDGIRADDVEITVPRVASITGSGTVAPDHTLDFKMSAKLGASGSPGAGGVAAVASVAQGSGGVPFLIHGTTTTPTFEPDVVGIVKGVVTAPAHDAKAIVHALEGKKKKP